MGVVQQQELRLGHMTAYSIFTTWPYAIVVYAVVMCLFVRLSHAGNYCTKAAKHRITETMPYDSAGTLVCWCQRSQRNSNGSPPKRAQNRGGVQIGNFRPISCHISEIVQDIDIVTIEH